MLIETVVLQEGCPVPSVWSVLVKYNAVILVFWQELVNIVEVPQLRILNDFGITPQNPLNVLV